MKGIVFSERTPQDRKEIPSGVRYNADDDEGGGSRRFDGSLVDNRPIYGPHRPPSTELEALLECAPGDTPRISLEEMDTSHMEAALSTLTEKELAVIELVVIGGMSLTVAGGWLGAEYGRKPWSKQAVANIRDGALKKMRVYYESV